MRSLCCPISQKPRTTMGRRHLFGRRPGWDPVLSLPLLRRPGIETTIRELVLGTVLSRYNSLAIPVRCCSSFDSRWTGIMITDNNHVVRSTVKPPQDIVHDQALLTVKRSVRTLLSRQASEQQQQLPASFEDIYRKCRFVVTVSKRSASLYESLKLDLERCVSGLASELIQSGPDYTQWMQLFVETCQWFETQVVRASKVPARQRLASHDGVPSRCLNLYSHTWTKCTSSMTRACAV